MTTFVLFAGFAVILILGMPVATALLGGSLAALLVNDSVPLQVAAQKLFGSVDSFTLAAIPFFLLAGALMSSGGISRRLTDFANSLLGWLPGGLAIVAVFTCMLFGCLCGSPTATVAAIGSLMAPALEEAGYSRKFSLAILASAGMLGTIIPPSTMMITYSSATGASVGDLFMSGVLPGVILGGMMILYCVYYGVKEKIPRVGFSLRKLAKTTYHAIGALLMPVIILGGIYSGVFTPTESAAVACAYGLLVGIVFYREIKLRDLFRIISNAASTSGMLMFIVASAGVFGLVMTHEQIPMHAAQAILSISSSKIVFLLLVNILLLIVGCFLEATAAILIIAPILYPAVMAFGISPVHFGIIMVLNLCVGLITPPLGVNLYVAAGLKNEKIETVINRHLIILIFICIINLLLITYFPQISLWLPGKMAG
ncbi:TRAP transporter large permease [Agathobaculum sp. NTUH-O15-33]|uniref:TRAP transporter large permease n=1 Tax=Agathobaculum sp. NTUH-O15-33 TaxID=3079302 RepID=UPI002958CC5C|nr:TRAP transporter large permease [Agathobaculum sp. NTUH-O15-33]WNX84531.1 TRAP transporter large permease [Agathobaculum sp. NTUH-O15-33]